MSVLPRTLRFRVVMTLFFAFLLSAGVFVLVMNRVVMSNHQRLEAQAVTREVARVRIAVEQQVAEVGDAATSLAAQHTGTGSGNASARVAGSFGLDFVWFDDGRTASQALPLSEAVITELKRANATGGTSGLALVSNSPAAVASRPLPGGGMLIVVRDLRRRQAAIADLTQADVTLADPAKRAALSVPAGVSGVVAVSDSSNLGWAVMDGIDGRPALLAVLSEPRPILQQDRATLYYIQWAGGLLSLLVGLAVLVTLQGSVLNRLVTLRRCVTEFPDDAESLMPVPAGGSDEIADLAVALNDTLARMKVSEQGHKHDARHDQLTGLANRRGLVEDADRILTDRRSNAPECSTLVLLDLDHFKQINDDLGHQVGDEVLVWFADHMREYLRGDSTLCRLGGDEFAVLLPHADREAATIAIERLREATSRDDDNPCFGMAKVRFSMGYAVAPDHGDSLEMLMQCADTDLYANKRGKCEAV